eukprot:scaffold1720_cov238-Pinguiococcus_pyrenoidosus.AAC.9
MASARPVPYAAKYTYSSRGHRGSFSPSRRFLTSQVQLFNWTETRGSARVTDVERLASADMYTRPSWCAFMQYCTLKLLSMHALLAGGLLPRALEEFNVARSHHTAIPLQRLCRGRPTIKLHVGLSRHPTVAARGKFDAILDHLEAPEEVEDVLSCRRERQAAHPQHPVASAGLARRSPRAAHNVDAKKANDLRCSRGAPDRISAISRGSPSGIAAGLGAVARKIPAAPSALERPGGELSDGRTVKGGKIERWIEKTKERSHRT